LDEGQTMFELVKIFIENFILFVTKNSLHVGTMVTTIRCQTTI